VKIRKMEDLDRYPELSSLFDCCRACGL